MTTIQVDFWNLVLLLLAFFGCIGAMVKFFLVQSGKREAERFASLVKSIDEYAAQSKLTASDIQRLEREFLQWKADVPVQYVRREDYIRGQAVLEAKMDALYSKLEVVQLKGAGQ